MAYKITSDCNNCSACEPECPNSAISAGDDIFEINPSACTECVGFHNEPRCAAVCPVAACISDPEAQETENILLQRARSLNPKKSIPDTNFPSHFKSK